MRINRNIFAILAFAMLMLSLCGCSYNELPPKTDDSAKSYIKPKGTVPTQAERDAVKAAKAEYEEAVKN